MPDFPSFNDLFRLGRDEVLVRNARISREAVERDGMDANILVAAAAAMADEVVGQLTDLSAALYLDSATGTALDRLVFDRYGMTRKPAAASFVSVSFSTTVASPTTFTIPTGTIVQTAQGVQFVTIEDSIFLVGTVGPLVVGARSVLAGATQNVIIGSINSVVSTIPSAASDLVVTNPLASAGGDDSEKDEALRDRARRFFAAARRGTKDAVEAAALGVPGVRKASAFDVIDSLGRPARFSLLSVADAYTEQFADYSTVPPRYQLQSQLLTSAVYDALNKYRALGIFVQVTVANVILQPVQLALTFLAGVDVNLASLQARAAIVTYINSLAPGKPFLVVDASAVLRTIPGLVYTGTELLSPAGDIVAKPLQVIRASLGLVSALAAQTNLPIITGTNPDAYSLA
jgi:hypothetical protein